MGFPGYALPAILFLDASQKLPKESLQNRKEIHKLKKT